MIPAAHYLPAKTRGRPTLYRKFLERQADLFPAELMAAYYGSPVSLPAALSPRSGDGQQATSPAEFFDLRRSSTADQSGLPDSAHISVTV